MNPPQEDPAYQDGLSLICVIRVGGVQVPFFSKHGLAEDDKDNACGVSIYYPYTHVLIDAALDEQTQCQTMFHELLHIISDSYGPSLKEAQVCCLEQGFTQIIQDNTKAMTYIFNGMARSSLSVPVLDALQANREEDMAANSTPSLGDRGVNLN